MVLCSCGSMLIGVAACGVEADGAGLESTGSDTQESLDFEPTPARGISILEVELNQGTRVAIGVGGDWIAEAERSGELIAARDSLMRIHYVVDPGWVAREIEARLTLELPDGSSRSYTDLSTVEDDSSRGDFNATFNFGLTAQLGETVPGTRYAVELWETEPGADALPERDWANPAAGPQPIGFASTPMQIKTVLVPITYQGSTPNLDETTTQVLLESLFEQSPVTEVLFDVHDPVAYESQLIDLVNLLPVLAELRSNEAADPNVYYHAFVDVGSSSLAGLYGISYIANDSEADANSRVSATVLWSPNPSFAADTFTHETGHAQGLAHVECPTEFAAEPDPAYPHADGRIGNWGFGIRGFVMYDPDNVYDYMSYCGPSWVSDWTWNKVFERVATLTAWDFGAGAGAGESNSAPDELLVISVSADGSRQWWTMPGKIDPARIDGLDRIEFVRRRGEVIEVLADVATLSDGRTRWIKVPLPDMSEVAEIRHVHGTEVASITAAAVGLDLQVDCFTPGCGQTNAWQPAWKTFHPGLRLDPSVRDR